MRPAAAAPLPPLPVLRTGRLWLRAMEPRDAPDVFAYARDPAVLRYTTGVTPRELAETETFLRQALRDPATYFWAIRDRPEGPVVGGIELGVRAPDAARLDYALAASHWGRGLMTEAVGAVTRWAFDAMPTLERIESAAVRENVGSWRVLEKCGFARVGEASERWAKQREPVPLWHYRLVRRAGLRAGALEDFFRADYAAKDTMHDLTHVRRVHRAAARLASDAGVAHDPDALLIGAYLHGVVYVPERERAARAFLREAGVSEAVVERAVTAARESQTDVTPATPEGILLHDGHLLEGGRSFQLVKTLVTGGARGSTLAEIAAFWERNVAGRFRCVLPAAQARYEEQEAFARSVFEELSRNPGLDPGPPAA